MESDERDPKSFLWLKMHNYQDNLKALESTRFRRPATGDFQYLEIGCGPGNFTTEALLPRLRPCRRLVATDKSAAMVDYASSHFGQPDLVYDVLDVDCDARDEVDGANRIVGRVRTVRPGLLVHDLPLRARPGTGVPQRALVLEGRRRVPHGVVRGSCDH
ncbi:hypothetical protein MTO96_008461 [Rhipicephalus appendiculatus]